MREGGSLIPQSVCGADVCSRDALGPGGPAHSSLKGGWVILLLVSSYLLCYTSACPTLTKFFLILQGWFCPRDTDIISPLILPSLLQLRVDCSLPKDSFSHPIEVLLPHINIQMMIGEP